MRSKLTFLGTCLLASVAACGDNGAVDGTHDAAAGSDSSTTDAPRVLSSIPGDSTANVALNQLLSATFSEPMDRTSLNTNTFKLSSAQGAVAGTVISTSTTVTFEPAAQLAANTTYTATITVGATSASAVALAAPHVWTFQTGTMTSVLGNPVNLGTAGDFVLLGMTGITNVPTSVIVGNIGVSPITSTALTGLPMTPDASNQFSLTPQVTGKVYAADFAAPTPDKLTVAIEDMHTAFTAAAGRAPDVTELGAGTIGSVTLVPGVYKWSSALQIPTSITLSGTATDVWIFQVAQDLILSSGTAIVLAGNASSDNIFWQVSGEVIVNTGAHLEGNVLSQTATTLDTGASLHGRLLAQTLVTVRGAMITVP
ncbi:MAG: ice-binding family protein [Kofleriaceae bacterium]